MGIESDLDPIIAIEDLGMMILLFRLIRKAKNEGHSIPEVAKGKRLFEMVFLVTPTLEINQPGLYFAFLKWFAHDE